MRIQVHSGLFFLSWEEKRFFVDQSMRRRMMDTKQLKKVLAAVSLAGLLAGAGLSLPGCEKHPPGQTA